MDYGDCKKSGVPKYTLIEPLTSSPRLFLRHGTRKGHICRHNVRVKSEIEVHRPGGGETTEMAPETTRCTRSLARAADRQD
jgi:hypothetical protein